MFLIFLKIGSVLCGSGYVLLAFLQTDFVDGLGWLSQKELIDAVAIGQVTSGPVLTTATCIGYLLAVLPGGLLATLGIFLPSFIFVSFTNPLITRLRESMTASAFLDGVNISARALIAAVAWQLGSASIVDLPSIALAVVAAFLLFRFRLNSSYLVIRGATAGWLLSLIT